MLYQLSYEATDVGSRSIVGSYVPVLMIWNKSYMNCGNEMKMKKWSSQWTQFMQLRKEAWKKFRTSAGFEHLTSGFTGVMLYQLSYEATDVGSRSNVGSYVPVTLSSFTGTYWTSKRSLEHFHCRTLEKIGLFKLQHFSQYPSGIPCHDSILNWKESEFAVDYFTSTLELTQKTSLENSWIITIDRNASYFSVSTAFAWTP